MRTGLNILYKWKPYKNSNPIETLTKAKERDDSG